MKKEPTIDWGSLSLIDKIKLIVFIIIGFIMIAFLLFCSYACLTQ